MDQETREYVNMHFDRGKRKQKESENRIGERILKRGYMEKHYQIIRIQKLNNFITDRLQMRENKNNDEQNQTNVWLAREGVLGQRHQHHPPPPTQSHIVQSPQLLERRKLTACEEERERCIYIYHEYRTQELTSSSKDYRSKQLQQM